MLNFSVFPNLSLAQQSIVPLDKEHTFVRHKLKAGEEVKKDTHRVDEWVIINNGHFAMGIGSSQFTFKIENQRRSYIVIAVPKGKAHWLKAISAVHYCVVRKK